MREAGFHTSETIFTLTEIPQSLIVIGGGPIGCELAQAFRRFGSEVVMLNGDERLLPREDNDVAEIIERQLAGEGMAISHGVRLLRAGTRQSLKQIVFVDKGVEKTVEGEVILVAIGRQPNIEGLGLEAAGVEWNESGVRVDDHLRTTNRRIYAAGDVCSTMMFTHAADAMARIAVRNALFFGHQRMSRLVVPRCTFTDPEVAHVGYSAAEAQADGIEVRTLTAYFSDNDRAILDGEESGMARIHYDRRTDRIIGGTIIARHAGEMIGQLTLAVTSGLKLRNLATTIQPYPTLSESLRRIADNEMLDRMPDLLRRLLRSWLVWNR